MTIQQETDKKYKQRVYKVEIGNNFETDISNKILSISITKKYNGDTYLLSEISPDEASLTVKNVDNYFNTIDLENLPIRIYSGYNGVWLERFRGFLRKGGYSVRTREYTLTAESYLNIFMKEIVNKEVLENNTVNQILQRCFAELGLTSNDYELQNTNNPTIPICDLTQYNLWTDCLKLILESIIATIQWNGILQKFIVKDFYNSNYLSQHTFTVSNISDFKTEFSKDFVKNKLEIKSEYLSKSIYKDKISDQYPSTGEIHGEIYTIQQGYNNRIKVDNYPLFKEITDDGTEKYKTDTIVTIMSGNNVGVRVNVTDMDILNGYIYIDQSLETGLIVSVDYKWFPLALNVNQERDYILQKNTKGTNYQLICTAYKDLLIRSSNDQITGAKVPYSSIPANGTVSLVSIEEQDDKVKVRLKNNCTEPVVIADLLLWGEPIKSFAPIDVKFKHLDSISKYGEKELTLQNDFLVSTQHAINYGNLIYSNMYSPIYKLNLPSTSLLAYVELGKVEVIESSTNTNGYYLTTSISDTMDSNSWNSQVSCIPYPSILQNISADWVQQDSNGNIIGNPFFNDKIPESVIYPRVFYKQSLGQPENICDIALGWNYPLNQKENPIDGFELYISVKSENGQYTLDIENDMRFEFKPEFKGFILRNLPLYEQIGSQNFYKYYAFCIRPYRVINPALTSSRTDYFSGNGIKTEFYVTYPPLTTLENDVVVKIDGVSTTAYSYDSNTGRFTFINAPQNGSSIQIDYKTTYPDGVLKGNLVYFDSQYKKIDEFTVYNGSTIESAVEPPLETTSLSLLNTMLNSLQKNKTYDSSIRFDDFRGMRLLANTGNGVVERLTIGQIEPSVYGMLSKNGDNEEILRVDHNGLLLTVYDSADMRTEVLKMGNLGNGDDGFKVIHSDGSYTQMSANGLERYVAGIAKKYFYLSYSGYASTLSCNSDLTIAPDPVTVQLPDEFKGKDFTVVLSLKEWKAWASPQFQYIHLNVDSKDIPNGSFVASAYADYWNIYTEMHIKAGMTFTYVVFA